MGARLLAEAIGAARVAAGLTREEFAIASGFSMSAIIKWERGKRLPGAIELAKLCKTLKVSCEALHSAILADDPPGSIPEGKRGRPKRPAPTESSTPELRKNYKTKKTSPS